MLEITLNNLLPSRYADVDISHISFIGIDFGTSTTVISLARFDQATGKFTTKAIPIEQELENGIKHTSEKIPTVLAYLKSLGRNKIIVGQGAADLKHDYHFKLGKNIWYSFKTALGTDVGALYYDCEIENESIKIRNPKDALRLFIRFLKTRIEEYVHKNQLPATLQYAVSIPASFEANQRKELIDSLAQNGIALSKQSLIDEPNAAFLSYVEQSFDENTHLKVPDHRNINILVFDFGAGTCDVSILEVGTSLKGLFSKNLSISKYYEIGGDDIDKYIALEVLLPQLAQQNGYNVSDFRKGEIKKDILPRLLKSAEQLKIMICEKVGLKLNNNTLLSLALAKSSEVLGYDIEVTIPRLSTLVLKNPALSYEQFSGIMKVFGEVKAKTSTDVHAYIKKFESVFSPINSALKKASLDKEEIDYVLFIGGSSKNPYIRTSISNFFSESEIIVPRDLQTHVSKGASLHSLVFNGFNKNIIQPITSEPILILTRQGTVTLMAAGTEVPSEIQRIEDLEIAEANQSIIELPVFLGNISKMLFNFKLYLPENTTYKKGTAVKVAAEINADKVLNLRAYIEGQEMVAEPLTPFANAEMTTEERTVLIAEKAFNLEAERNGGKPSKAGFENLYTAYLAAGKELQAAQTLEEMNDMYPNISNLNHIGVLYSNAGKRDKAIEYYEKAYKENPENSTIAFNLALQYKHRNRAKFEQMIEDILTLDPSDPEALLEKGRILNQKTKSSGNSLIEKALAIYQKKFDNNDLQEWEFSWMSSCASDLGKHDLALLVEERKPQLQAAGLYNTKNLTQTKTDLTPLKLD